MFPKGSYMLSKVRAFVDFLVEEIAGTGEHRNSARIGLAAAV
jgi:hypothetical protein